MCFVKLFRNLVALPLFVSCISEDFPSPRPRPRLLDTTNPKVQGTGHLTRDSCPECPYGLWSCSNSWCSSVPDPPMTPQAVHIFDFQYFNEACSEEIPVSSSVVQIDHDIHCLAFASGRADVAFALHCDNMAELHPIGRNAALEGCTGQGQAENLLKESCSWICKNLRPIIRCTYTFDTNNVHGFAQGKIDYCVASARCLPDYTEELQVVCQERVLLQGASAEALEAERKAHDATKAQLTQLKAAVDKDSSGTALAMADLEGEMLAHEATKNELLKERAAHNATQNALEEEALKSQATAKERDEARDKLQEEKKSHSDTKKGKETAEAALQKEKDAHKGNKESLLKSEQALKDARNDISNERLAHNITKGSLSSSREAEAKAREEHDEAQQLWLGILVGLAAVTIALACIVYKMWKRRAAVQEVDMSVVAKDGQGHVVIGHPCPPDRQQSSGVHDGCAVVKKGEHKKEKA